MKRVDPAIVDPALVARIADAAATGAGPPARAHLRDAWRIDNPYSTVWCLRLAVGDWTQRYFVKQPKRPDIDGPALRPQLQREYAMLLALHERAPSGAVAAAVQPLALFADVPALVTLAAEGPTLRQRYARDARRWSSHTAQQRLCALAALAGRWLAGFQDQTAAGSAPYPIDELLAYLDVRMQRLAARLPGHDATALTSGLKAAARQRAARLPATRLGRRHNDFAGHNLIVVRGEGLRVLDFAACDTGPASFDPCNFWFELELLKLDPSYSAELLMKLQQAFLAGYGRISPGDAEFELARLRYTLNRLLNELDPVPVLGRLSWRRRRTVTQATQWLRRFARTSD
jgi:Ser/Thr protein kinase RdoA (MazF antagonist)